MAPPAPADVGPAVVAGRPGGGQRLTGHVRLQHSRQGAHPSGAEPGVDEDAGQRPFEPRRRVRPPLGEVEVGRPLEPLVQFLGPGQAAHPVGPHVAVRACHQVPDAGLQHEAQRRQHPVDGPIATAVADPQAALLPHRPSDHGELLVVLLGTEPGGCVEMEPLGDLPRLPAELRRQGGRDLRVRGGHRGSEAEVGERARRPHREQRHRFARGQPVEAGTPTVDQPHAPVTPGLRPQRHAQCAQRRDVAVHRALGDPKRFGQLRDGGRTTAVQGEEQGNQPFGAHPGIVPGRGGGLRASSDGTHRSQACHGAIRPHGQQPSAGGIERTRDHRRRLLLHGDGGRRPRARVSGAEPGG